MPYDSGNTPLSRSNNDMMQEAGRIYTGYPRHDTSIPQNEVALQVVLILTVPQYTPTTSLLTDYSKEAHQTE